MGNLRADTTFLRAVAICLIINSHMDNIYPIKLLATGGTIGNSIFFMLSSLGLYLSWQKRKASFANWYGRRIVRIYPPMWLMLVLLVFPHEIYIGSIRSDNFLESMGMFFFPPFWFLQALVIFYFFIFFILKNYSARLLLYISAPLLLLYGIYYGFYLDLNLYSIWKLPFTLIFYFLVLLWGLYLGSIKETIKFIGIWDVCGLLLCIGCIYLHKYLMYRGLLLSFQFIEDLAIFPMLFFFLKVAKSHFVTEHLMQNAVIGGIANFISKLTMEIYVAHTIMRPIFEQSKLGFPLIAIVFIAASIGTAFFVFKCSHYVRHFLELEEKLDISG